MDSDDIMLYDRLEKQFNSLSMSQPIPAFLKNETTSVLKENTYYNKI